MSYDLAVWEGERPSDDATAGAQYESLMDQMESGEFGEPSPRIRAYVEALLAGTRTRSGSSPASHTTKRYPDLLRRSHSSGRPNMLP
jgi:hypothetical protein